MDDPNSFGQRVLERAKFKNLTKAEQHLEEYRQELLNPSQPLSQWEETMRQLALSIIDSGIFCKGELKGKKLPSKGRKAQYKTFPVDNLGHLVKLLVDNCLETTPEPVDVEEALEDFDNSFKLIAHSVHHAGVSWREIKKVWKEWREKLAIKIQSGSHPWWWYGKGEPEEEPRPLFERLFPTLLFAAPKAPHARIAEWVNTILKALGERPVSDRTIRKYISEYINHYFKLKN
jgi:hypothetical protein